MSATDEEDGGLADSKAASDGGSVISLLSSCNQHQHLLENSP